MGTHLGSLKSNLQKSTGNMPAPEVIFKHPYVHGGIADPSIRQMPKDLRQFRHLQLQEIPGWVAKRDWSPIGLWYALKRNVCRHNTIFMHPAGHHRLQGTAMLAVPLLIGGYIAKYRSGGLDKNKIAKYHW